MPELRADYRSGQICAVLANIHRVEGGKSFSAADFVSKEPEAEDGEQQEFDPEAVSGAIMTMLGKRG